MEIGVAQQRKGKEQEYAYANSSGQSDPEILGCFRLIEFSHGAVVQDGNANRKDSAKKSG